MLQIGYRQIVAILLGVAITITSLSFVYKWHKHFTDYQGQIAVEHNDKLTTATPIDSRVEARMALTYCANQLLTQDAQIFEQSIDGTIGTSKNIDVLQFFDGAQEIDINQLLTNDADRQAHYRLRRHHARQFELEVSYD